MKKFKIRMDVIYEVEARNKEQAMLVIDDHFKIETTEKIKMNGCPLQPVSWKIKGGRND